MENPKPPARLHTLHVLFATLASIISIVGGVYSLKATFFQGTDAFGQLTGSVRDERLAKPLRLATVEVSDANGDVVGTLSTDDNGAYFLKDLKEGNYQVRASAPLHVSEEKRVSIQKNRASTIDFNLTPIETSEPPPTLVTPPAMPVFTSPDIPVRNIPLESAPADEGVTQRQPTSTEVLVKAGALLVEQMLEKKKKKELVA